MEKILHIIEVLVKNIAGANGLRLLKELIYKENVSEIKLAENLKLGVNEIRSLLYKLQAYNLVYSTRKKDKEKGWYIYYWTFNFNHARDLLNIKKKKNLNKLKDEYCRRKTVDIYECKNKCIELNVNEAMGYNFRCPECEQLLEYKNNVFYLEKIGKEIKQIEEDLEILKQPIKVTVKKDIVKVRYKKVKKKIKLEKRRIKKKIVKKGEKRKVTLKKSKKVVKRKNVKKKKVKPIKREVKKKINKGTVNKSKKVKKMKKESTKNKKGFFGNLKRKVGF